ncbi:hypothetical protein [Streptomyces sp. NBC_01443]|uniref:hypothetical protein n=1 Tax=Streptomyces sp. NBC_01443 TaxID=2903868 RepID=UPI0022533EA5|nr:hypothetical protein [Streptomyces sp. NBC_01443]MCX4632340.1 hypothetical protein [Streptomyces sp. NBC_01443]
MLLQTRRGSLVHDRVRDVVAAAEQLPDGLVLDGELVVWTPQGGCPSKRSSAGLPPAAVPPPRWPRRPGVLHRLRCSPA